MSEETAKYHCKECDFSMADIIHVFGREIMDSRGNPTVEAEVLLLSLIHISEPTRPY